MQIANPIYDVVFKYLLDDNKVAKKLIGLIIDREILELELRPTEYRSHLEGRSLTVLRLDFAARVRLNDGSIQQIIIEIQKAKYHTDIQRFRKYLAAQYADRENTPETDGLRHAIPIFSIYLLGHKLDQITAPVIRVERSYVDAATGESIPEREAFIEGLTHDSIVIQIPYLRSHRRNKLEQVLSVFEQAAIHTVEVNEDDYPDDYRGVIRRLLKAGTEQKIRQGMDVEDEILEELEDLERAIARRDTLLTEKDSALVEKDSALAAKDSALAEKDSALAEKDSALAEKNSALAEKNSALAEKNSALEQKESTIKRAMALLMEMGLTEEEARNKTQP